MHYKRWRAHGDPLKKIVQVKRVCTIGDCLNLVEARGMCPAHYGRWRSQGDPEASLRILRRNPGGPCEISGCEEKQIQFKKGLCHKHFYEIERKFSEKHREANK